MWLAVLYALALTDKQIAQMRKDMGGASAAETGNCNSGVEGDVRVASCESWCDPDEAEDHCRERTGLVSPAL